MNTKLTRGRAILTLLSAFTFLLLHPISAGAIPLKINVAASHVEYTPPKLCVFDPIGGSFCSTQPATQRFSIEGNIDLEVIHEHFEFGSGFPDIDRDLLKLRTSALFSGATSQGFFLDGPFGVRGLMSGEHFYVSDNTCFLFVGPGSCSEWIVGVRTGSGGTWDGQTLEWEGFQSNGYMVGVGKFTYSIQATVVTVSEPGTFLLLIFAIALLSTGQFSKTLGKIKRSKLSLPQLAQTGSSEAYSGIMYPNG